MSEAALPPIDRLLISALDREPVGVAVLRPLTGDFAYLYVNGAFQAIRPDMAMEGQTLLAVWPEVGPRLVDGLKGVVSTGRPYVVSDVEIELEAYDTRQFTFEASRFEVEGAFYIVVVMSETTELVHTRRESEDARRLLQEILDRTAEGLFAVDSEWRFTFVSPRGLELLDNPAESLIGQVMWDRYPGLEDTIFGMKYLEAMRTQRPVVFRGYYAPLKRWFDVNVYPSETGLTVFFVDAEKAVEAERELATEQERLRAVLAALPVGVSVTDADGRVLYANEQNRRIWGGVPAEPGAGEYDRYIGWSEAGEEFGPGDWAAARALGGDTSIGETIEIQRFDGSRATVLNSAAPIRGSEGEIIGAVVVFQDISQRKRLEDEMAEHAQLEEALNRINQTVHSTLEVDEMVARVVTEAAEAARFDAAAIHFKDDGGWRFEHTYGVPDELRAVRLSADEAQISEEALAKHRPIVVADAASDTRAELALAAKYGVKTAVAVPLLVRGQPFGVFFAGSTSVRPVTTGQVEFLSEVGWTLASALENARLAAAEQEVRRAELLLSQRTATLKGLGEAAASSLDLMTVASRICQALSELLGPRQVLLRMLTEDGSNLKAVGGYGLAEEDLSTVDDIPVDAHDETASAFRHMEPRAGDDMRSAKLHDPTRSMAADDALNSYAIVPVVLGEKAVGTLYLAWEGRHVVDNDELNFLQAVTVQFAVGLQNARTYEAERTTATVWRALADISALLTTASSVDQVMTDILRLSCEAIGSNGAVISERVDDGWRTWHVWGVADRLKDHYSDKESPARVGVEQSRKPRWLGDVMADPSADPDLADRIGYRSYVAYPLLFHDKVNGAISFFFAEPMSGFPPVLESFVDRVVFTVAAALANNRLLTERFRQAEYAEALNRINDAIHSTLDFEEIMGRVVVLIAEALRTDFTFMHIRRDGHWEFADSFGLPSDVISPTLDDEQARISTVVRATNRPVVVSDVANDPRVNRALVERMGITAMLAVPLVIRGQVNAVLITGCRGGQRSYDEGEVDFTQKAAAALAMALENARLYQAEHHIADRLQSALLSLPENVPGVRFSHAYHSATEQARVGGDFYDLFQISDELVGVTIGDVAGKGLEAAVLTSLVKNAIRAHASEIAKSPGVVLGLTNEMVYRATTSESFVTVFFGVFDRRDGSLVYANAGHTTAIVMKEGGIVSGLPTTGPLLGAFGGVGFGDRQARLQPRDILFLYTDGLTEARGEGGMFGEERIFEVLKRTPPSSAAQVISSVIDSVFDYTGGKLNDDLAMLAVEWLQPLRNGLMQTKLDL